MPEINVSEELYRQIRAASDEKDLDQALWRMVGSYRRTNNPESDMA